LFFRGVTATTGTKETSEGAIDRIETWITKQLGPGLIAMDAHPGRLDDRMALLEDIMHKGFESVTTATVLPLPATCSRLRRMISIARGAFSNKSRCVFARPAATRARVKPMPMAGLGAISVASARVGAAGGDIKCH
jgi:hypothetical protein